MKEVATGYGLVEAPVWDAAHGLYFSDVHNGGVFLLDLAGKVSTVIPKRRGVGGAALHAQGGLVIGGKNIAWVKDGETKVLLSPDQIPGIIGFNDFTTDAAGRIYVGSLAFRVFSEEPKPGYLHVIDLDGSMRTLSDGVILTNGLGFSPDGKTLYHSDARGGHVRGYDVKPDGSVGPWRVFAEMGEGRVPDGLKVASDGSVWVADARGGRVAIFEASGKHRGDLAVPLPMVTSLCFGGDDLKDLYVVTGSDHSGRENCGTVFKTRVDVAGLAWPLCRVKLPN